MNDVYMYSPKSDPALIAILLSNILSIALAYIFGWNLLEVLWIYWGQSVIIGAMNFKRIRSLKKFSAKDFRINGRKVKPTIETRNWTANFFAFHFGGFHVGYAVFLLVALPMITESSFSFGSPGGALVLLCILAFASSHIYSFAHNGKKDFKDAKPDIGTLMFYPYMRIIPMHITIIFGFMFPDSAILIFMGLKTVSDIGMHIIEHRLFQKKS